MERFRKYFDKTLNVKNIKNSDQLKAFGVTCKSLSEPLEDFDEVEFTTDFSNQVVLISIVVISSEIKRIQFTLLDPEDPDIVRGLAESQLKELLNQKGEQLAEFF
jgi:spore germination protein GerM